MESLIKESVGGLLVKQDNQYTSPCFGCDNVGLCDTDKQLTCGFYQAMEKLREYERLEKDGYLIRIPCKIGDVVFVIPSKLNYDLNVLNGMDENNRVYEQTIHSIQIFSNEKYLLTTCEGLRDLLSSSYKETWFLDENEAKQKLKELGQSVVNGISAEITSRIDAYLTILSSLGVNGREPSLNERQMIDAWFDVWQFDLDTILEACKMATRYKGSCASMKYVDSVLYHQHKNSVVERK